MTSTTIAKEYEVSQDQEVWGSLKKAIAKTSGFKSWQNQKTTEKEIYDPNLEDQVCLYLQETLETLAY